MEVFRQPLPISFSILIFPSVDIYVVQHSAEAQTHSSAGLVRYWQVLQYQKVVDAVTCNVRYSNTMGISVLLKENQKTQHIQVQEKVIRPSR